MDPKVWGPHGWVFLHSITLGYPTCPTDKEKESFKTFFESIQNILPCDKCRINYKNHLKKLPLTNKVLCSRKNLFRWLVDVHNSVNRMHGKPEMDYDAVIKKYNSIYSSSNSITITFNTLAIILLTLVLVGMVVKFYRS